jgi:hypothetical protein
MARRPDIDPGGTTMAQPIQKLDARCTDPEAARTAGAAGFKPLALPALAAAVVATVRVSRKPQARVQDIPAILRKEAALG